jgi:hypothetical protein
MITLPKSGLKLVEKKSKRSSFEICIQPYQFPSKRSLGAKLSVPVFLCGEFVVHLILMRFV